MYPEEWDAVYCLCASFEAACQEMARLDMPSTDETNLALMQKAREEILQQLHQLKEWLHTRLERNDTGLVLFGLTLHFDERILTGLYKHHPQDWPLLQKQFLRICNGGDDFFLKIDYMLNNNTVHPFVYEVYYFCLKRGFRGRYYDFDDKIASYMTKLELTIMRHAAAYDSV